MPHDAELSATELVRRAERCIGLGIRQGQEEGEIRLRSEPENPANQHGPALQPHGPKSKPADFVPNNSERTDVYALTDDVSDEEFVGRATAPL